MPTARRRPIRIGCSGWNYASWKQEFYEGLPARLWLEHYARHFDTVEVNNTFYRLPRRQAVANWVAQTPPGFLFAVKASRYLTHIKRLNDLGPGTYTRDGESEQGWSARRSSARSSGSCRRTSSVTTSGSHMHSRTCRASNCTASSSGIPRGSPTTSTRCFGGTASHS